MIFTSLLMGFTAAELNSSNKKVKESWSNSPFLGVVSSVSDYGECQKICKDTVGCEGWTYTDSENEEYQNHCWLYSQASSQNCISGSSNCEEFGDNRIDDPPALIIAGGFPSE